MKYEHDAQASGYLCVTHLLALRACMGLFAVPGSVVRFFLDTSTTRKRVGTCV
jgi:hypothetical protein